MIKPYRYPERGHVYRHCVMCGRPFRVCNSQLARRSARFCTVRCYHTALRAFSEALAGDRLGLILGRAPPDKPFFLYYVPGGSHAPAPRGRTVFTYSGEVSGTPEGSAPSILNKS